jgi:hypothetical protein
MQATDATELANEQASEPQQRRRRTGKKRLRFEAPQWMPPGVKELWRASSSEAQAKAHRTCVEILAMWLGKKPREEVARTLEVPPLRVWQLSQQALSGMLAGLLKQPRTRSRSAEPTERGEDNPRVLKAKVAALEAANKKLEGLVELLKELPRPVSAPPRSTPSSPAAKTHARRSATTPATGRDRFAEGDAAQAR